MAVFRILSLARLPFRHSRRGLRHFELPRNIDFTTAALQAQNWLIKFIAIDESVRYLGFHRCTEWRPREESIPAISLCGLL